MLQVEHVPPLGGQAVQQLNPPPAHCQCPTRPVKAENARQHLPSFRSTKYTIQQNEDKTTTRQACKAPAVAHAYGAETADLPAAPP